MATAVMNAIETGRSAQNDVTIRLTGIYKYFSGVPALRDVSVEFLPGEVHAMNIIAGTLQASEGEISYEGERIQQMTPEVAASLGIAICFQHPAILEDLSVLENLCVALPPSVFAGRPAQEVVQEMLDAVGLQLPLRSHFSALGNSRMVLSSKPIAVSATSSFSTSGVLVTMMPLDAACVASTPS